MTFFQTVTNPSVNMVSAWAAAEQRHSLRGLNDRQFLLVLAAGRGPGVGKAGSSRGLAPAGWRSLLLGRHTALPLRIHGWCVSKSPRNKATLGGGWGCLGFNMRLGGSAQPRTACVSAAAAMFRTAGPLVPSE